ncbi:NADH dehydrogenase (ubiquinone) 1 alpha subcomplex subunit 6 [Marchantia polymorpha subsp. ruderalis]|uniref:NADH dehydrogenase [ubiquinone] 1 alpha subcomplex subunit 6 n=2 Tax=Marchantia polymorpha TaxID=3197 RepID=A0A176VZI0_MARPO|nr:hypothetical protein AXG93_812s1100 [Marchantia polymorpha subsp. ruderalis]PTQ37859.1 hypothetical protein MARPO_0055s0110 [Marchantia polymorpha]PTQ37860.1 hypothetical protein MARPO_0055s0110 [Marchantia polymorpha]BBN02932.1 hypothetical protein Mp_2g19420 [Marchantia polymorpha subsp. ruderalis]BBN02933.1 hypothetical protein Mp_2g19420 [Marchantia polymorpha subsp. ruderalis]|eukprot:PTQ37859.1 hypothetical protein MARPO_0055s0110 [Marchantia polymorpha]
MALSWNIARATSTKASSASMEEARHRTLEFFREACRALPQLMDRYNLDEVITQSQLRSKIAAQFRKHAAVTNPKIVDMLVFKGKEELQYCLDHAKQRHHLISTYVVGSEGQVALKKLGTVDHGESKFLKNFYQSNLF